MNEHTAFGARRRIAAASLMLALAGCGGSGKVEGWIEKPEGSCPVPKTALSHGLAYIDATAIERGGPAMVEVVLSDRSLPDVDPDKGYNPLLGAGAPSPQLYVMYSVPFHGLGANDLGYMESVKRCVSNLGGGSVAVSIGTLTADRVAFTVRPLPPGEGEGGARDGAELTVELPVVWPKDADTSLHNKLAAERAMIARFEREATATYRELHEAVARDDVAAAEKRLVYEGWGSLVLVLDEMVFDDPSVREQRDKLLPVVAALAHPDHAYTRAATKPDVDWDVTLALCDPADAARRATVLIKRQPDGSWRVAELGDADAAAGAFGTAGACTPLALPAS
jgi:hypothetical protein